jgi:UDP-N-acetylmuramoylalanine--D-glutamate ligase
MIHLPGIEGQTFAVMGLGGSGLATVEALAAAGARVQAWDDDGARRKAAEAKGIALSDLSTGGWEGTEALVLSPGIPHTFPAPHPVAAHARDAGIPIICDIELLARAGSSARFIGITGTNGKSTVTALIGHIFKVAGRAAAVGGNLGPASLNLIDPGPGGVFVLELSSYQIERIETAAFDIAVLINISPDHLDRHGGIDGYVAAKEGLFDLTRPGAVAVIGTDDAHCRAMEERLTAREDLALVPISGEGPVPGGIWVEDRHVMDGRAGTTRLIADLSLAPQLPGSHNAQNAAAATAVALSAGVSPEHVAEGLATYPGLPHRQETVRRIGAVSYINDSKATNPDATLRAIACYPEVYWIAGGRAKDGGFAELTRARGTELVRVCHAFLIGEAAEDIAAALNGAVPHSIAGTLEAAVAEAHHMAQTAAPAGASANGGPVVLLSPACASFDQFSDFAARGEAFRQAVATLEESAA